MRFWTWAEIKEKIEEDCDLQEETFISRSELLKLANIAIDEAEAEIHGLYEDYFLNYADTNVAQNAETINIPVDIYGMKIRRIFFYQGSVGSTTYHRVHRLPDSRKFEEKAQNDAIPGTTGNIYQFFPINRTAGAPQIMFTPKIQVAGVMRVWYLRNANRLYVDTDVCDIPEFINFIFARMKVGVYSKEGHPGLADAQNELEMERQRMIGTLQSMVPDDENQIDADYTYYDEQT